MAEPEVEQGMLYWLAEACKEARVEADRLQVHIAAELSVNQSTIDRFEDHKGQPTSVDAMVDAYAADLEIESQQLWARALELWLANEQPEAAHAAKGVEAAKKASQTSRGQSQRKQRAKGKRPVAG